MAARVLLVRSRPSSLGELRRVLTTLNSGQDYPVYQGVADSTIAYRLSFLATHFPAPFYAAALTAACGQGHTFHAIAAEARSMELPLLPPDISTSAYGFTPTRSGILSGLIAVRGMTLEAWSEIRRLRDGGPIGSLREFANRVGTQVTRELLANLVYSGCFDHYAPSRPHLFLELDHVLRELHDAATPSPDRIAQFSAIEILQKELEATDHLLTSDASRIHERLWKACHAKRPEHIAKRHFNRRIAVHGRIIGLEEPPIELTESQDCIIADMEGLLLAVPKRLLPRFEPYLHSELPILALGKIQQGALGPMMIEPAFFHPDELQWGMDVVETIHVDLAQIPSLIKVTWLAGKSHSFGGGRSWLSLHCPKAPLHISKVLDMASRSPVHPVPPFLECLRDLLPDEAIRLECKPGVDPHYAWRILTAPGRSKVQTDVSEGNTEDTLDQSSPAPLEDSTSGEWNFNSQ